MRGNFDSRELEFPLHWPWKDRRSTPHPRSRTHEHSGVLFLAPGRGSGSGMGRLTGGKDGAGNQSRPLLRAGSPFGQWNGVGHTSAAGEQWRWRDLKSRSSLLPSSPLSAHERPIPEDSHNLSKSGPAMGRRTPRGAGSLVRLALRLPSPLAGLPRVVPAVPGACSQELCPSSPL